MKHIGISPRRVILLLLLAALLLPAFAGCRGGASSGFTLPTRKIADPSAEELKFGSYGYRLYDDGNIIITSYDGGESSLTIPQTIGGGTVIAIGDAVFLENAALQSVSMGKSVEMIGEYAFYGCGSLHSVEFGPRLWSVGAGAFEETPWLYSRTEEFVTVGDGVLLKYNGEAASVRIPDNVKHISGAFAQNYTLISAEMGDGVLTLGSLSFAYCTELKYVRLGGGLRLIGDYAFAGCEYLAAVDIPDRVEKIGDYAFESCYFLADVRLGASLRELGNYAFYRCFRLRSLTLPVSLTTLGYGVIEENLSLGLIFYTGGKEEFDLLTLGESNYLMRDIPKVYNYIPPKK